MKIKVYENEDREWVEDDFMGDEIEIPDEIVKEWRALLARVAEINAYISEKHEEAYPPTPYHNPTPSEQIHFKPAARKEVTPAQLEAHCKVYEASEAAWREHQELMDSCFDEDWNLVVSEAEYRAMLTGADLVHAERVRLAQEDAYRHPLSNDSPPSLSLAEQVRAASQAIVSNLMKQYVMPLTLGEPPRGVVYGDSPLRQPEQDDGAEGKDKKIS